MNGGRSPGASVGAGGSVVETVDDAETLIDRSVIGPPGVDDDGLLHYDHQWVALGPIEAALARALVQNVGRLVRLEQLEAAGWASPPARGTIRMRVLHLRRHLEQVGLELRTVRGRGYVLEVVGWGAVRGRSGRVGRTGRFPWRDERRVSAA